MKIKGKTREIDEDIKNYKTKRRQEDNSKTDLKDNGKKQEKLPGGENLEAEC